MSIKGSTSPLKSMGLSNSVLATVTLPVSTLRLFLDTVYPRHEMIRQLSAGYGDYRSLPMGRLREGQNYPTAKLEFDSLVQTQLVQIALQPMRSPRKMQTPNPSFS